MRHLRRKEAPTPPPERTWRCEACKGRLTLTKGTRATTEAVAAMTAVHADACPGKR